MRQVREGFPVALWSHRAASPQKREAKFLQLGKAHVLSTHFQLSMDAADTIEERMEAWKDMDGADDTMGEVASTTDALSVSSRQNRGLCCRLLAFRSPVFWKWQVLDHEKHNTSESLAKIRFLLGISQAHGAAVAAAAADTGGSAIGARR